MINLLKLDEEWYWWSLEIVVHIEERSVEYWWVNQPNFGWF